MPAQIFGTEAAVLMLNRAFVDASPSNGVFGSQVASAGTSEATKAAFATEFGRTNSLGMDDATLAQRLMSNLGLLPNEPLQLAVRDYLAAVGMDGRGIVALQLGQILSGLEGATGALAVYAKPAAAWNQEILNAYIYSVNPANTETSPTGADDISGERYTLSANEDGLSGTPFNDVFSAPLATLSSGTKAATFQLVDRLDGGAGADTLDASFALASNSAGSLRNIETVVARFVATSSTLDLQAASGITDLVVAAVEGSTAPQLKNIGDLSGLTLRSVGTGATITGAAGTAERFVLRAESVGQASQPVVVNLAVDQSSAIRTLDVALASAHVKVDSTLADAINQIQVVAVGSNSLAMTDSSGSVRKVLVNGSGSLDLSSVTFTNIEAFDASAQGGGTKANLQASGSTPMVVKGGAGADRISVTAALPGSSIQLGDGNDTLIGGDFAVQFGQGMDGGPGTDVVNVRNAGLLSAAAAGNIKGFEVLDIAGGVGTFDLGLGSLASMAVQIDQSSNPQTLAGAATLMRAGKDFSLHYIGKSAAGDYLGTSNALTIQYADASGTTPSGNPDTFTLKATLRDGNANGVADGHIATDALQVGGVERVVVDARVDQRDSSTTTLTASAYQFRVSLQAAAAESITVLGDASIQFQGATTLGVVSRVDASAASGGVTLDLRTHTQGVVFLGSSAADTYSGGLGGDTIHPALGADSIRLSAVNATKGAVRDTVQYKAAAESRLVDTNADGKLLLVDDLGYDRVFNFDLAGDADVAQSADRLDLSGFAFSSALQGLLDVRVKVGAATSMVQILDLFKSGTDQKAAAFTVIGADTYVMVDANVDGHWQAADDLLVKLQGVSGGIAVASLGF